MKRSIIIIAYLVILHSCYMDIPDMPVANFEEKHEGNGRVTFTNTSLNSTSFTWDFGDSKTEQTTDKTTSHQYSKSGKYSVKLIATGEAGSNGKTREIEVTVDPAAVIADFTISATNEQKAPCEVTFTNTSIGNITTYQWKVNGSNVSTDKNIKQTFSNAGTYKVSLTATGPNDTDSKEIDLVIKSNGTSVPVAKFSTAYTGDVSAPKLTFTNTSEKATSYLWNFGDGKISTETSPSHDYTIPGVYNVILVANGPGGTDRISDQVFVYASCKPTELFNGNDLFSSTTTYQYNEWDNVTSIRDASNGSDEFVNTFSRSFNGRFATEEISKSVLKGGVLDIDGNTKFFYNELGLLVRSVRNFSRVRQGYQTGDKGTTTYEYDSNYIISKITADSTIYNYSNGVLTSISYIGIGTAQNIKIDNVVYSGSPGQISNGRIQSFAYTNGAFRTITYDSKGRRIIDVFQDPGRGKKITENWSYDDNLNPSFVQGRLSGHPFYAETGVGNTQNNVTRYSRNVENTTNTDNQNNEYNIEYNSKNLPNAIRKKNDGGNDRREYKYQCR